MPTPTPKLDALVDDLCAEFDRPVRGSKIAELLRSYAAEHVDWREFALFAEDRYTRNLVHRGAEFELLVLCWGPGQRSPIHNHEGQNCWMGVLEGGIEEVRYDMPTSTCSGPPDALDSKVFEVGQVAFIRDEIGLHLIRGAVADVPAVSLHLYAKPYDTCSCYCPETGEITRKALVNYSERGNLCETPNSGN